MRLFCLCVLALAAAAHATDPAPAPATTQAAPIVVVPATIEALEQADLYAKTSGFIAEVKVDIGDHVKAQQILALIDNPELESELAAANATVIAKRELANASRSTVEQAQTSLKVAQSQRAAFDAEVKLAEATFKRQEELFAGKAITDQQLDEARTKAEVAKTQLQVGDAKIAAAEADVRAAQANQAVAAAQVGVAEAEVKRLASLLNYTKVVAPFDGVVSRRLINRGDLAQSGVASRTVPLFSLARMDIVRVVCEVPEAATARIATGGAATVKVFGGDAASIDATITRFAGTLNPETRTMRTEIHVPNPDEKLRPGMYAQVTLTLGPTTPLAERR
jgi:multidrug efflux pump subunit AcrA (membrane-fusion protein)